jgi:predicted TPR repeat methyltransferase
LTALRDDTPPPRTSDRAIQHIYKSFAASYESRMLEDLKYVGPERIEDLVRFALGDQDGLSILDLGCGSGLAGVIMKKRATELVGVDLSAEMIELAQARKIYDRLEVAEITGWLEQGRDVFDLIVSTDCLIYFGDLNRIVNAAAKRVKKSGLFAFSLERGARYPFHLTDTGRYTHSADHVRDVATNAGLTVMRLDESFLRLEYGVEVIGLFVLLRQEGRSLALSSHAAPACSTCA